MRRRGTPHVAGGLVVLEAKSCSLFDGVAAGAVEPQRGILGAVPITAIGCDSGLAALVEVLLDLTP